MIAELHFGAVAISVRMMFKRGPISVMATTIGSSVAEHRTNGNNSSLREARVDKAAAYSLANSSWSSPLPGFDSRRS
jgi:hypothetical protein